MPGPDAVAGAAMESVCFMAAAENSGNKPRSSMARRAMSQSKSDPAAPGIFIR
jgi:hypothetical protein